MANARIKNLADDLTIEHISANKKDSYPRMASKGRRSRSFLETTRIEIVLKGKPSLEKKIEVKKPEKPTDQTTAVQDAKIEKKIEADVKKEIIRSEEQNKEKVNEKKAELGDKHIEKRQIKPRQIKGEKTV